MRRLGLLLILWRRFRAEAAMVWRMLTDRRAPLISKAIAIVALLYLASPVDFVSDFVPLLGWLDDGLVLAGLLWLAYRFLPPDLYDAIRRHTGGATAEAERGAASAGREPNTIEGRAERVT